MRRRGSDGIRGYFRRPRISSRPAAAESIKKSRGHLRLPTPGRQAAHALRRHRYASPGRDAAIGPRQLAVRDIEPLAAVQRTFTLAGSARHPLTPMRVDAEHEEPCGSASADIIGTRSILADCAQDAGISGKPPIPVRPCRRRPSFGRAAQLPLCGLWSKNPTKRGPSRCSFRNPRFHNRYRKLRNFRLADQLGVAVR